MSLSDSLSDSPKSDEPRGVVRDVDRIFLPYQFPQQVIVLFAANSPNRFSVLKMQIQFLARAAALWPRRLSCAVASGGSFEVFFDGGSRGNPGISGAGALIDHVGGDGQRTRRYETFHYLDCQSTNNVAEYVGLLLGLRAAVDEIPQLASAAALQPDLAVRGDSMLAVRQINGSWAVQAAHLRGLRDESRRLLRAWRVHELTGKRCTLSHVRREANAAADALANAAMDARASGERYYDEDGTLLREVATASGGADAVLLRCAAVAAFAADAAAGARSGGAARADALAAGVLLEDEVVMY